MRLRNILVIDNYDSFVYNLVQYIGEAGATPIVRRNDKISVDEAAAMRPDGILISPGPGHPESARVSNEILSTLSREIPTFGVCLGQQCLGYVYGASVVRAPQVMHGKTSEILHDARGVFAGLASPLVATRYHSLIVDPSTLGADLMVSATSPDGLIMGLRHKNYPIETVQFHPESVLTLSGHQMVENFLNAFGLVS